MNKIARKLVLSALTVVLTMVALGTTTFAWFTLTNTAVVQPFQASIVAADIEVSLDTIDWYTTLTEAVIEDYIANQTTFTNFTHLTTATGAAGGFYTLGATGLEVATGGWLSIPLYFRSNSASGINWTAVSMTVPTPLYSWLADVAFTATTGAVSDGSPLSIDATNAMRISVTGTISAVSTTLVYEKSSGSNDNVVLGTGGNFADGVAAGEGNAGSYNYYFVKTGALIPGTDAVVTASSVTTLGAGVYVTDLPANTAYGTTNAGQITIRIWLEGWDADAYNSVLAQVITAGLTFVGA